MGYKKAKFDFEKMFQDNWFDTPVHYAGQEFKADGIPRWVNPFYAPSSTYNRSITKDNFIRYGMLNVVCWAENDVEVFGLADDVTAMIQREISKDYSIRSFEMADHGWNESNSAFALLLFQVEYYESPCITPPIVDPCMHSVGGKQGLLFALPESWKPICPMFKKI